jgi:uncharacterized protein (DUF885 family)
VARTGVRLQGRSQRDQPLRDESIKKLGPKFELAAFNDTIVLGGNVPLDVLNKNVEAFVRTTP